jgi:hypothetical protein
MRRARALSCLLLPVFVACSGMPRLLPLPRDECSAKLKCNAPFLARGWRLIHSINGTFPGGGGTTMIGVTEALPAAGRLRCVLMSVEGLVLCDATYDGKLSITRGIGPFSNPDLVMGMVRDIRFILFAPPGAPDGVGLANDRPTCRYRSGADFTDISPASDGTVDAVLYSGERKARTARFSRIRDDGLPCRIELEARGAVGYSLLLDLLEAEPAR